MTDSAFQLKGFGMLCLARKENEGIAIGADVFVKIMRITPKRVLVGIAAPEGIPVYREEIAKEILDSGGEIRSLARQKKWLHVWEQGEYRGSNPISEISLANLLKPDEASYRGVFWQITDSPNCPLA